MAKDYYKILGVDKNFDEETLKKAYKKACLKYHPDRQAGKSDDEKKKAEENFKDVQEAYECLSDTDKRSYYDRNGSMDGYGQGWSGGADMFSHFSSFFDDFDFPGFGGMFGGNSRQQQGPKPGQNLKITVPVNIKEIMMGGKRNFKFNRNVRCKDCNGNGGSGIETCSHCHGTGMITEIHRSGFGMIQNSRPCQYCGGTGKMVKNVCHTCNGSGFVQKQEEVEITIPVGVNNGGTTQVIGKGCEAKSSSASNGNLIIQFIYDIDENKYAVSRDGTIYEKISVPYYDCILGNTIKRTLPTGQSVDVKIPKGTNMGTQVNIKYKGIRNADYIFVVEPFMPSILNKDEQKLLEKIQKLHK